MEKCQAIARAFPDLYFQGYLAAERSHYAWASTEFGVKGKSASLRHAEGVECKALLS
jgi:hypothetical protein